MSDQEPKRSMRPSPLSQFIEKFMNVVIFCAVLGITLGVLYGGMKLIVFVFGN